MNRKVIKNGSFFRGVEYFASYTDCLIPDQLTGRALIAFSGRSNSGKSSLISALCDHTNLARVSKTAGKTRMLNYFHVPEKSGPRDEFFFVDMPGFGYAKLPKTERIRLRKLIDQFLLKAKNLALLIIVLDSRRDIGEEERNIFNYSNETGRKCIFVRTKWDKLNKGERKLALLRWAAEDLVDSSYPVSSTKKIGLDTICAEIRKSVSTLNDQ